MDCNDDNDEVDFAKSIPIPKHYYDSKHSGWCYMMWGSLHSLADAFPINPSKEKQESAKLVINNIAHILPCAKCQDHMLYYIKECPPQISNGYMFTKWMYDFHNDVRKRSNQKELTDSEAKLAQEWIRSVKWSAVEKDLKTNCTKLCTDPISISNSNFGSETFDNHDPKIKQECAKMTIPTNFRRIDLFNNGSKKQYKYLLLLLMAILIFISLIIIFNVYPMKKENKSNDKQKEDMQNINYPSNPYYSKTSQALPCKYIR